MYACMYVYMYVCMHACMYVCMYCSPDAIAPRGSGKNPSAASVLEGDPEKLEQAVSKGEGRATLRLKKDGQAVVEEVVSE